MEIPAPEVRRFLPKAGDIGPGFTRADGLIWLSNELDQPVRVVNTVAHEVKHHTHANVDDDARAERDAVAFASRFVRERYEEVAIRG